MDQMRKLLCLLLTAAVLCSLLLPVFAAEPEDVLPIAETTEATDETTEPEATTEETAEATEETEPEETYPPFSAPYTPYFGLLHSHTEVSSGKGTAAEAYAYADEVAGLDFFAVTDTSHSFDDHLNAAIDKDASSHSPNWAEGVAAAEAATKEDFAAIFGYEMSWLEGRNLGHVITFNTPGFQSSGQEPYKEGSGALREYYKTLTKVPQSLSIFCHPGSYYGNFRTFKDHKAAYDNQIHLLEVTDEMGPAWDQYDLALNAGWHVAPSASQNNHYDDWGTVNDDRTVILAEKLTRESLFDAIRSHRVYATRDKDLHLYYTLNGEDMGSTLSSVEDPVISLTVYDPTDSAVGKVEVITESRSAVAAREVTGNYEELTIPIQGRHCYYYLKITQPDGDIAVTAPVWMEDFTDMGISTLECDTQVPIVGEEVKLELTLYNEEPVDLELTDLKVYWGEELMYEDKEPGTVPARETLVLSIPYTHPEVGEAQLRIEVTGTARGEDRSYSQTLELEVRSSQIVTGMMVDGSHGCETLDDLSGAVTLASEADMATTLFTEDLPRGGEILVIPGLEEEPSEAFQTGVAEFLQKGGILILWSRSEDGIYENQLLEAVGSTMRFTEPAEADSTSKFNKEQPWCADLTRSQFFRHTGGPALEPGDGSWLVKTDKGQTVLAREAVGGGIFAAGCPFLEDEAMDLSDSIWAIPRANESIFRKILGTTRKVIETSTIRQTRKGKPGEVYRIKGYVTAGTANPHTIFPDTIYVQDDTGGIAVTGYTASDLKIGKAIEIMGILKEEDGNLILAMDHFRLLAEKNKKYTPDTMTCQTATSYLAHGGELVKIQGKITKRTLTKDKKGITALTVKDSDGGTANVIIESTVLSGTTGKNALAAKLKAGTSVRVIGILHRNEKGEEVIRVRDCDEVVYVKPAKKPDTSNPRTGDPFAFLFFLWK